MENLKITTGFISILVSVIAFGFACTQLPGFGGQIIENVVEIESGSYSNYPNSGDVQKVITKGDEFSIEWQKVFSSTTPVPEEPDIDFKDRQVILLMLETKSSGGFGIKDLEVIEGKSDIIVRYTEVRPGDGCILTQAITKPYLIFSIPASDKQIKFGQKEIDIHNCE